MATLALIMAEGRGVHLVHCYSIGLDSRVQLPLVIYSPLKGCSFTANDWTHKLCGSRQPPCQHPVPWDAFLQRNSMSEAFTTASCSTLHYQSYKS